VLLIRSLIFAILIPGMVVGVVPYLIAGADARSRRWDVISYVALIPLSIGVLILAVCIRDFLAVGQGTLAPMDPPKRLVRAGLYQYVRNPMYLGALCALIGQTLLFRSPALGVYTVLWFAAVNAMVFFYEEPHLRRVFGESYDAYCRTVGRWVPGRR
jgi:protein-S-isoprenylcysteine O-methyltransferase Ste14